MDELVKFVKLLESARWSTIQVEQMHGSMSVIKTYHPMYTTEMLTLRSFLHLALPLLKPATKDFKLHSQEQKIVSLQRRCPQRVNAGSAIVRNMYSVADASLSRRSPSSFARSTGLMK